MSFYGLLTNFGHHSGGHFGFKICKQSKNAACELLGSNTYIPLLKRYSDHTCWADICQMYGILAFLAAILAAILDLGMLTKQM